jgi:hypothetical protein
MPISQRPTIQAAMAPRIFNPKSAPCVLRKFQTTSMFIICPLVHDGIAMPLFFTAGTAGRPPGRSGGGRVRYSCPVWSGVRTLEPA